MIKEEGPITGLFILGSSKANVILAISYLKQRREVCKVTKTNMPSAFCVKSFQIHRE